MSLHTNDECRLWLEQDLGLQQAEGLRLGVEMVQTEGHEMIAAALNEAVFLAVEMPREVEELRLAYPPHFSPDDALFRQRLELAREMQFPLQEQRRQAQADVLLARAVQQSVMPDTKIDDENLANEVSQVLLMRMGQIAQQVFAATDFEVFRAQRVRRL